MGDLVLDLSPTQSAFVHSDANIVMLKGPMGEGKTHAGTAALMVHAVRCGRPIRGALIRDTHQNIKISTVPDIQEILGKYVTFHDDQKKMVIHCTPRVEMDLFGIDDPASLSKLQGPQYAIIWLEEPAPIIEKANAGLPRDVFDMSVARAARQTGTTLRVQVSQNPANEDHWTEEVWNEPEVYATDPDTGAQIVKACFNIPYGENKYLNPLARVANRAAFKHDKGKFARYVQGIAAPVQQGKKVTTAYNAAIHFAKIELPVISGAVGIRGFDAWHHPVCIIGQTVGGNRLWIHNAVAGEGIAMRELINQRVIPLLASAKFKGKIHDWQDTGDPTMATPDQSTINQRTSRVVETLLDTRFEPGPTRWRNRIDPTNTALSALAADGSGPLILISKSAYNLHRALNGGWHWKTDNSGNIIGTLPVKDSMADLGDAFSYIVSKLYPSVPRKKVPKKHDRNAMALALSYGHSRPITTPIVNARI